MGGGVWTLKKKFLLLGVGIVVLFLVIEVLLWNGVVRVGDANERLERVDKKQALFYGLLAEGLQSGQALRNIYISLADKQALKNLETALAKQRSIGAELETIDRKEYEAVKNVFELFIDDCEALKKQAAQDTQLDAAEIKSNTQKWRKLKEQIHKNIEKYNALKANRASDVSRYLENGIFWITALIGVGILLVCILMVIVERSVTKSITKAVTTINNGAMQISSASDQVASSSTSLAQGASEQASSVEEVSATLEQATAGVTSNTENARQADILAKQTNAAAKDGLQKGEELVRSMKEATESAAKIANIVKTIDQIAFQVNLLALNAAVEAARAGEHGLGFAVVADEVRNLAQRAANSAKETGAVIEEAVTQIKKGSEIANAASNSFREIDDKAKKVSDLIGEVTLSGREQAEGMGQLSMAMSQIDQVTQQVAANSEEAAAASEELNAQAAATIEAVATLAKIVGIDVNQNISHQKMSAPRKMELKKEVKHIAFTPKHVAAKQAPRANKNTDEIFPLDERDLKEF